ncbi:metallophosphoesterase [Peribacillus deserti]|uniref:Metallophosphoesterase n=1 Tax=Peribacillus deserti TaxID=673318 RepID=A0A2N5M6P9_9BACI|nr:metallophosphoesterase [Peribacillus deserti]PLT30015.1 metallophosphoesterase [Peribacillus deserti]
MVPILIAVLLVCIGIQIAYKNTKDIAINRIQLESQNGSAEIDSALTVLQLSDLHLEHISISPEELYNHLEEEPIDLIALTGDFLDRKRTIPKLAPYLKVLNDLGPKYGIYAVLGNHDYVLKNENLDRLISTLEEFNCTVLRNENRVVDIEGRPFNIIGIDDFSTQRSNIAASYQGIAGGSSLVITHDPNIVLEMQDFHFDYLLAGHFHGGQICYPKAYHLAKMGKLVKMKMIKGLHEQDGKPFYINEGLGQTGVNIRVGSRPEITIHQMPVKAAVKVETTAI